jgi:glucuronate isomerase
MAISKKKTIFTDQFLLESKMANKLYHNHVGNLPIIDYHNPVSYTHLRAHETN